MERKQVEINVGHPFLTSHAEQQQRGDSSAKVYHWRRGGSSKLQRNEGEKERWKGSLFTLHDEKTSQRKVA